MHTYKQCKHVNDSSISLNKIKNEIFIEYISVSLCLFLKIETCWWKQANMVIQNDNMITVKIEIKKRLLNRSVYTNEFIDLCVHQWSNVITWLCITPFHLYTHNNNNNNKNDLCICYFIIFAFIFKEVKVS